MKKTLVFLFCISIFIHRNIAQNYADISTAKEVCNTQNIYIEQLYGVGNQSNELETHFSKLKETNIAWFKFKIGNGGTLKFEISPIINQYGYYDDIDFVLFKDWEAVTYSISGPVVKGNERSYCKNGILGGKTGVSNFATDLEEDNGICDVAIDGFTKDILVSSNEVYYLAVNNFQSKVGFNLSWFGDCSFTCSPNGGGSSMQIANPSLKSPLSIVDLKSIYPNPTNDIIHWDLSTNKIQLAKIRIIDEQGKVLFNRDELLSLGAQRLSFSVANYPAGMYSIIIENADGEQKIQKFIKTN